ncbi:hypothetical_protein (plasmid) [Leishmania braziliensis MHOM/BR/75/M2904]|uniref:Hypothetical_protein n=1 Tax=Leishmania braziliensis MHOM/BR/75/M2904 TaxID=420245 RepID=A0A3P3Z7E3_LEIBR|nr:hypothetical_protein [Leishmania braziliensis MHOM/BR/75/M2904]
MTDRPEMEYCEAHNLHSNEKRPVKGDTPNSRRTEPWGSVSGILYTDADGDAQRLTTEEKRTRCWAVVLLKMQAVMNKVLEYTLISRNDALLLCREKGQCMRHDVGMRLHRCA